jgi:xanthine/CO dehydrogenase XdhC/CoxF family maturation factor
VSGAHPKPKGASLHTIVVYEEDGEFVQYAGAGRKPVAVYDRERAVLESARRIGLQLHEESIRVVFVIPIRTPL